MSDDHWNWILNLDEEMLRGDVILSEYAAELIRNADICFVHEAYVACLVMTGAAIETWLREVGTSGSRFIDLIEASDFDEPTKLKMHELRRQRNRWVHIDSPWENCNLEKEFNEGHPEMKLHCQGDLRLMRSILYSDQGV